MSEGLRKDFMILFYCNVFFFGESVLNNFEEFLVKLQSSLIQDFWDARSYLTNASVGFIITGKGLEAASIEIFLNIYAQRLADTKSLTLPLGVM